LNVKFEVSKYVSTDESTPLSLDDYIEIGLMNNQNQIYQVEKIRVTNLHNKISILSPKKPSKVILDPNLLLIDKRHEDNVLTVQ